MFQQHRTANEHVGGAHYRSVSAIATSVPPDIVVLIRSADCLMDMHQQFPDARLIVWYHTYHVDDIEANHVALQSVPVTLLCVSCFHQNVFKTVLKKHGLNVPTHFIYNPVADDLKPNPHQTVDKESMVYFSSPDGRIEPIFRLFPQVRRAIPSMKLVIGNPGYYHRDLDWGEGVSLIPPLPHHQMMARVASSLCSFYPNTGISETFGLVYAESNAVGTPVLTHHQYPLNEILQNNDQFVDCHNGNAVIETLKRWRSDDRPTTTANPRFHPNRVIHDWHMFLGLA